MNGLNPNDLVYFRVIVTNIEYYLEYSSYQNNTPNSQESEIFILNYSDKIQSLNSIKLPKTDLIKDILSLKPSELIDGLSSYSVLHKELLTNYTKVYNLDSLMIFYKHFLNRIKKSLNKLAKYKSQYLNTLIKKFYNSSIVKPLNDFYIEFSKKYSLIKLENEFITPIKKAEVKRSISMYLKDNYIDNYNQFIFELSDKRNFKNSNKAFLTEDFKYNLTNQSLYMLYVLFFEDFATVLYRKPSKKVICLDVICDEFGGKKESLTTKNNFGKRHIEYYDIIKSIFERVFKLY